MDRLVSVRLAKLERALHAAETRVSDLEARSRVDLNRRVSVLEAWAQSTDEVLNLIVEAERAEVPTYDPATEVVMSRVDAEWAVSECVARQKNRKNRVNRAKAYGSHLEPANRRRIAAIKRAKGALTRLRRALAREEADRE